MLETKSGPSHTELESVHTAHLRMLIGLAGHTCPGDAAKKLGAAEGERSHTYDVISDISMRKQAVLQVPLPVGWIQTQMMSWMIRSR